MTVEDKIDDKELKRYNHRGMIMKTKLYRL